MESSMMNKQFKKNSSLYVFFLREFEAWSLYIDFEGMKHNEIQKDEK